MRFKEPVSGFTHLAGAIMALIGMIWLIYLTVHDIPKMISVIIFGLSMLILYTASTALHLFDGDETISQRLQRIDHAAIFVLIAGTYTPFCYNLLSGEWRWAMLGLVWGVAGVGVFLKLFYFFEGHLSTLFYVAMGWLVVFALPEFLRNLQLGGLTLVALGGVIYMLGAVVFALNKPNFHRHFGHHELWHLFVMAGTAFHFFAIRYFVI